MIETGSEAVISCFPSREKSDAELLVLFTRSSQQFGPCTGEGGLLVVDFELWDAGCGRGPVDVDQ